VLAGHADEVRGSFQGGNHPDDRLGRPVDPVDEIAGPRGGRGTVDGEQDAHW
jgi:hypothetical protein